MKMSFVSTFIVTNNIFVNQVILSNSNISSMQDTQKAHMIQERLIERFEMMELAFEMMQSTILCDH